MTASPAHAGAGVAYVAPPLEATAPRRQLQAELASLGAELDRSPYRDAFAEGLRRWHAAFVRGMAVNNTDLTAARAQFLQIVKTGLEDPVTQERCLGSDNRLYNLRRYREYFISLSAAERATAPTVRKHPLFLFMITWLASLGETVTVNPEIDRIYDELAYREIDEVAERRRQQRARMAAVHYPTREEMVAADRARIDATFRPEVERVRAVAQAILPRIAARRAADTVDIRPYQERQIVLQREVEEHTRVRERHQAEIGEFRGELHTQERAQAELKVAVAEAEMAIKESQKNQIGEAIMIAVACIAASYGLHELGIAIFPEAGGGLSLFTSVAL